MSLWSRQTPQVVQLGVHRQSVVGCPEMVRHRMFRDWLTSHPEDRARYADAKRSALTHVSETGDDHGALGFGMRYNAVKQPVVREIYDRMFRAAGLM